MTEFKDIEINLVSDNYFDTRTANIAFNHRVNHYVIEFEHVSGDIDEKYIVSKKRSKAGDKYFLIPPSSCSINCIHDERCNNVMCTFKHDTPKNRPNNFKEMVNYVEKSNIIVDLGESIIPNDDSRRVLINSIQEKFLDNESSEPDEPEDEFDAPEDEPKETPKTHQTIEDFRSMVWADVPVDPVREPVSKEEPVRNRIQSRSWAEVDPLPAYIIETKNAIRSKKDLNVVANNLINELETMYGRYYRGTNSDVTFNIFRNLFDSN